MKLMPSHLGNNISQWEIEKNDHYVAGVKQPQDGSFFLSTQTAADCFLFLKYCM